MSSIQEVIEKVCEYVEDLKPIRGSKSILYSKSKNMRIQFNEAGKIPNSTLAKFKQTNNDENVDVAMFVSCSDNIPFNIDNNERLTFFVSSNDLTPRFLEYLSALPNKENKEDEEEETVKQPKTNNKKAKEAKPKTSFIDKYESTPEGFDKYCHEVVKTKIEYKKAKEKWPNEMKQYKKQAELVDYVVSLKDDQQNKTKAKPSPKKTIKETKAKPTPKKVIEETKERSDESDEIVEDSESSNVEDDSE